MHPCALAHHLADITSCSEPQATTACDVLPRAAHLSHSAASCMRARVRLAATLHHHLVAAAQAAIVQAVLQHAACQPLQPRLVVIVSAWG